MTPDQPSIDRLAAHLAGSRTVSLPAAAVVLTAMWDVRKAMTGLGRITGDDLVAALEEGRARHLSPELVVDLLERRVRRRLPRYRIESKAGLTALVSDPAGCLLNIPDRHLPRAFRSKAAADRWTIVEADVRFRLGLGFTLDRLAVCWDIGRSTLFARQRALNRPSDVQRPPEASDPAA